VSGVGQDSSKEHAVKSALKLVSFLALFLGASASWAQDKVVYHFDGGPSQATAGLRNIYNHLEVDPKAKIVAVAHADGVLFLMEGAKDRLGPYDARVQDLMSQGVKFQVCEITLRNLKLKKEQFIMGPSFTPSGVVLIAKLQAEQHYAYIKP